MAKEKNYAVKATVKGDLVKTRTFKGIVMALNPSSAKNRVIEVLNLCVEEQGYTVSITIKSCELFGDFLITQEDGKEKN